MNKEPNRKEKTFTPFRTSGMHYWFGDIGLSCIWGAGSYTENHDAMLPEYSNADHNFLETAPIRSYERIDAPMMSDTMEIYALGPWDKKLHKQVLRHFKVTDFPIGWVDMEGFIWVLAKLFKYTKK